jgi:non-heme chloroperoxidase
MRKDSLAYGCLIVILSAPIALLLSAAERNPWRDEKVEVGDIKVHYLEAGTGDRALVFIPGWTMIAEIWKEQIPYFSSRGYHVYVIDPRSQGSTNRTEEGNTYRQQAADLHAWTKTLKLDRPVLVGWSAGVTVLLEYISSPETLTPDKLVFVDGGPLLLKQDDYPGGLSMQQARTILQSLQEDRSKFTDEFVRGLFKTHRPELLYKQLTEGAMKTTTGAATALFADLLTGDRRSALARIDVPTLIIVVPEDRMVGEYMQSRISRSKLEVIPEAGHAMFLEKPQSFNQILESFLEDEGN